MLKGANTNLENVTISLKLVKKERKPAQMMAIEAMPSTGPMENNIDPHLQEDELIVGPIEELGEVLVDANEPTAS